MRFKQNSTANAAVMTLAAWSMLYLLTGCETTTPSKTSVEVAAPTFCDNAKPIHWSASMTDAQIREIKAHNAVGVKLCGWGK